MVSGRHSKVKEKPKVFYYLQSSVSVIFMRLEKLEKNIKLFGNF